jgi:hypothetical protein
MCNSLVKAAHGVATVVMRQPRPRPIRRTESTSVRGAYVRLPTSV